jgi:hypothetical protein
MTWREMQNLLSEFITARRIRCGLSVHFSSRAKVDLPTWREPPGLERHDFIASQGRQAGVCAKSMRELGQQVVPVWLLRNGQWLFA